MAAAVPDTQELLELLKRAADELKESQHETAIARTDAETFARKLTRLESELVAERERAKTLQQRLDEVGTTTLPTMPALGARRPLPDERTNVLMGDASMVEQRLKMLQDELSRADAERRALKDAARELDAVRSEVDHLITQNSKLEAELASAQAKFQAIEHNHVELEAATASKQAQLNEVSARSTQLEQEAAALRARRDALNVELAHVEQDRKELKGRLTELEAAAAARESHEAERRGELEAQLTKEKERHQNTAQRLLEARSRSRELEVELDQAVTKASQAEAEAAKASQLHREALSAVGEQMNVLQRKLDHASTEWVQVNWQYEQLHKEMLTLLDQRDEARRALAALKG